MCTASVHTVACIVENSPLESGRHYKESILSMDSKGMPNRSWKVSVMINMLLIFHLHLLCKAYYAFHIPRRGLTAAIRRLRNLTDQKAENL